jgi:hypothetical protein
MKKEFRRIAAFVLHWFVRFPVIGAIAIAFVGVLAFGGGRSFGLPDLFWHQVLVLKLLLIGFSTAIVLFLVCIVGFLLESEDTNCSLQEYVTGTYPLLFLCVVAGTFRTVREPDDVNPWWLLLGHVAGIVFAIATTWSLIQIARRLIAHPVIDRAYARASRASPEKRWLHVYASLVIVGFALVYAILAAAMPRWLPSAVAVCLIFCILLLIYGFVRFQFPHERIVVSAALIAAMALAAIVTPYKHRFPALDPQYEHPIAIPPTQSTALASHLIANDAVLGKWLSIVPAGAAKPKLAIIATSGGGIRAAVWTTAVLNALTTGPYAIPSFPYHVRVLTGASGGMVGAAYFAASVPQPFVQRPMTSVSTTVERKLPPMADDSLEPVARSLALRDLPGMLAFWSFRDRGSALEEAWSQHAPGVMDTPFSTMAIGEREGWRPSLIFTPMLVEDGRRLLVSNLDLSFMLENHGPQIDRDWVYSRPSLDLFRLMPAAQSMPVAAAARMNASFPWVAPAAELPTIPRRHVVDAGYWDNFGVHTSVTWIERNLPWLRANTSGVVVIQIRDVESESDNNNLTRWPPALPLRAFDEFIAPVVAALRGRQSAMTFHNDKDLEQITNGTNGFVTTVVIENPIRAVLSWSLTRHQAIEMLEYFEKHPTAVATQRLVALRSWWTR